jgi:hypothetical protein
VRPAPGRRPIPRSSHSARPAYFALFYLCYCFHRHIHIWSLPSPFHNIYSLSEVCNRPRAHATLNSTPPTVLHPCRDQIFLKGQRRGSCQLSPGLVALPHQSIVGAGYCATRCAYIGFLCYSKFLPQTLFCCQPVNKSSKRPCIMIDGGE